MTEQVSSTAAAELVGRQRALFEAFGEHPEVRAIGERGVLLSVEPQGVIGVMFDPVKPSATVERHTWDIQKDDQRVKPLTPCRIGSVGEAVAERVRLECNPKRLVFDPWIVAQQTLADMAIALGQNEDVPVTHDMPDLHNAKWQLGLKDHRLYAPWFRKILQMRIIGVLE